MKDIELKPIKYPCIKCGEETIDLEPGVLYTSSPPQMKRLCIVCGHAGFMTANVGDRKEGWNKKKD